MNLTCDLHFLGLQTRVLPNRTAVFIELQLGGDVHVLSFEFCALPDGKIVVVSFEDETAVFTLDENALIAFLGLIVMVRLGSHVHTVE